MSIGEVIMSGSSFRVGLLAAAATVLLAAGCGSGTAASGGGSSPAKSVSGGVLGVATTSLGPVLVDSKGLTVYLLTADTPGHSTCSAQCLQYWPIVAAPSGTGMSPVPGIIAALTTTKSTTGASMVAAGGWPLYTFVKDQGPGDVTGEGVKTFGGTWYAVSPSGTAVKAPATSAPAAGAGGGGSGY